MTPERRQDVSRIFHAALARAAPVRAAFVRDACGGDDGLCREVISLIEQPSTDGFLAIAPDAPRSRGRRLGSYAIGDLIGSGCSGSRSWSSSSASCPSSTLEVPASET